MALILARRSFLTLSAPAIVLAANLMPLSKLILPDTRIVRGYWEQGEAKARVFSDLVLMQAKSWNAGLGILSNGGPNAFNHDDADIYLRNPWKLPRS